ncbi:MAG: hypothetical protein H0X40_12535 [Chthoniobacterales bacterium]|nr:hypothetical protein [Chthoniobacterales bacterium]
MKSTLHFVASACAAAVIFCAPEIASAKGKQTPTPSPTAAASVSATVARSRAIPFRGQVLSVDIAAKTFSVGKRTFHVTDQTVITDNGAPARISDIVPVEAVTGSYWKRDGGMLEAKTVKIGAKTPEAKPTPNESPK